MSRPIIDFTMAHNLNYVQEINRKVADHLFPNRTFSSMMMKTYEELGEMVSNPKDPEEVADILIMLMDHMDRVDGHVGYEVLLKLQKNLDRKWREMENGVFKHTYKPEEEAK